MRILNLDSRWSLRCLDGKTDYPQPQLQHLGALPATVPGHVHLDLMRHGVIPNPFERLYENACAWVDERSWSYETEFEWTPSAEHPTRVLRFEGLDTVCTVYVNDEKVADHDNMFLPLEVDVTERLQPGLNRLRIDFQSAIAVGRERRKAYFEANGLDWQTGWFDERAFVRKAGYMSGWDWGPRLVSAGIWQPVQLLEFCGRIKQVSYRQERLASGRFRVWAEPEVEGEGALSIELCGQRRNAGETLEFELDEALWWPAGEGSPNLHRAVATLDTGHRIEKQIGLRTVRLLRERDEIGRSFEFEVNGRRIYARGANWIPNDSFPARITPEEVSDQIGRYRDLGMNMLRVWGGGFYESEAFYDACDQVGILVWQDFLYACMYYPDGPAEQASAREEASVHVRRLRDRASLALWCGNNENEAMWTGRWGGDATPPRYYGGEIYDQVLREVVAELDPEHDYIRSSPIAIESEEPESGIPAESWGDSHYWNVWHGQGDWAFYADSKTRFSSEFGFASAPSLDAWKSIFPRAEWSYDAPDVWWHDKTGKGRGNFVGYVELHYPASQTLEDWTYYSQLNQRDALRFGIEHYRRSDFCRGTLIWQINDCWPVQSWAVEDYRRLLKPAGHELARLYAPFTLSLRKVEGGIELYAVNDAPETVSTRVLAEAADTLTGDSTTLFDAEVSLKPRERRLLATLSIASEASRTAIRAVAPDVSGSERWEFAAEPKETQLSPVEIVCEIGEVLRVSSDGFVADLVVWDDENGEAVLGPNTGVPGWAPVSGMLQCLTYGLAAAPVKLRARSLAGEHPVRIVQADRVEAESA